MKNLAPRIVVVTGANTGIGAACALELAALSNEQPVHLVLACRSKEKTLPILEKARALGAEASFVALDLGDLAAAKRTGEELASRFPKIDLLVNNAGVAGARGLTKQGFEVAFGTNHLGHFAFTSPLFPALRRARGRVVNVSSGNHFKAKALDFEAVRRTTKSRTGLPEYGVSKLANVLFTAEIRRRFPEIEAVAVNPGRIASDIWRRVPMPFRAVLPWLLRMGTVEVGGHTLVNASQAKLSPELLYFHKLAPKDANPLAKSPELAEALWTFSEQAVRAASLARTDGALLPEAGAEAIVA